MHNLHYEKFRDGTVKCIEEEIPFDVPNGWEWCRLSNICLILNGDRGQNYPAKSKLHSEGIPFVSASNIIDGEVSTEGLLYLSDEQYDLLGAGKLELNDIVFCIRGSLGKCGYFTMEKGAIASSLVIVRAISNKEYLNGYIFNYLNSLFAYDEIKKYDNGSAQPNLAAKDFQNFLVPLPANEEIGRISDKCEILLMNENNISVAAEELQDCISNTKSKILDLAIRGKLVPQNPNDEPASILLKRIREEKESLIKQGKIKHDKKESIIYKGDDNSYYEKLSDGTIRSIDEELPFEIPNNWHWERIRNLFNINPKNNISDDTTVSFIPMALLDDGYSGQYSSEEKVWKDCKKGFTHFSDGDVCFAKISPCFENRKSAYFKKLINGYGAGTTELYVLRRYTDDIIAEYLLSFVKSEYFISRGRNTFSGVVGQQRVDKEVMLDTFIPLPPSAEQVKIISKISKSFSEIANIEDSIN